MEITKQQFEAYEECRKSGITNMLIVSNVQAVTGLDREDILYIMKNYEDLRKKFS